LELLQPTHLSRQQPVVLLLPIEIGRLADPGLAADVRNRNPVVALLQDKRLLGVRKLRGLHRRLLLPAEGFRQRKTLAKNGPVFRPQINAIVTPPADDASTSESQSSPQVEGASTSTDSSDTDNPGAETPARDTDQVTTPTDETTAPQSDAPEATPQSETISE